MIFGIVFELRRHDRNKHDDQQLRNREPADQVEAGRLKRVVGRRYVMCFSSMHWCRFQY